MHYVICYDLENDRLREKVAKVLQRHGCNRVQKSVFFAANMNTKHLEKLKSAALGLFTKCKLSPQDTLLFIPLPDECARMATVFGSANNLLAASTELPSKIML